MAMDPVTVDAVVDLVRRAGDAILAIYRTDFDVEAKADDSPLTQADLASHRVLAEGLAALSPQRPLLSEESSPPPFEERRRWSSYWLIDPLDGTKEFIKRNGEFTVNVALMEAGEPVFGVVGVPDKGLVYVGDVAAGEAWRIADDGTRQALCGRPMAGGQDGGEGRNGPLTIVASRSHGGERLEAYLEALSETFGAVERTPVGSSLKLCILAEGRADLYPRLGPTSEWDIAAAHAVLRAAGGELWAVDGSPLAYNAEESFLNPEFFAVGDASYGWRDRLPAVPAAS